MNDQLGGTGSPESGEAPGTATLRPEDLPGRDLTAPDMKDLDLTQMKGLLPEHLAGTILTGRALPPEIAKFEAVAQVKAISSEARKIFIGLLAACVYCWLVIGTTTDVALILNTASSPLPIINTPIPIAGFYVVGAALLAAVYGYFHFYLLRLWRTLATLPAVFPDGVALDDKTDPWLLTNLVRTEFPHLRATAPPLARLENLLTIVLAWWIVPVTLIALWVRYLPAHGPWGTPLLLLLIAATTLFGRHSFRLAKATLRREPDRGSHADGKRGVFGPAIHELGRLRPDKLTVWLTIILAVCSISAFRANPRDDHTWVAKSLNFVGIRTYANLREVDVAERPEGWDGEDWSRVRRVDLRNRNLAFADATRAFLANADLRGANLTGAILERAEFQGAVLYDEDTGRIARLQRANLRGAQLQDANLQNAQLQGANLQNAQLQDANLRRAQLQGANLWGARLQGANLQRARLQSANLRGAHLQGADLWGAGLQDANLWETQLQGANLWGTQLQGANLSGAQLQAGRPGRSRDAPEGASRARPGLRPAQLQGADLRRAALWRALVIPEFAEMMSWDLADLRGADVRPRDDAEIGDLITQATIGISDDERRRRVTDGLTAALSTGDRPPRPDFPEAWGSDPNVMFTCDGPPRERIDHCDPVPLPFPWGRAKWFSEHEYDRDLAEFLGDLACGRDVPEAQTRGLANRAVWIGRAPDRLWPRIFAARVTGPDCPPAAGLPEDMRRNLEELAAQLEEESPTVAVPETSPPDPE
jgi:uncharacterized protein YjbI with pentapeptide repeats